MQSAENANLDTQASCQENLDDWMPINSCPWQTVVEVKNDQMDKPCLATRGYVYNGTVHPNRKFFTTVYTPDRYFPTPSGQLCCPTEWRLPSNADGE